MIAVKNWNELPKNCEECPLYNWEQLDCNMRIEYNCETCPLIEI